MKNKILDIIWITIAAFLPSIAVNFFFIQTGLAPGGITGMALVLSSVTNIDVEIMSLCVSIPLLVLSTIFLGKSFGAKTLYITLTTPLFIGIMPIIPVTDNLILAAIVGGVIIGLSVGIAICRNCATGGSDVMAFLIHHFIKVLPIRKLIFIIDGLVIISAGVITKDFKVAIFSLFSLIVIVYTIKFTTKKFANTEGTDNV